MSLVEFVFGTLFPAIGLFVVFSVLLGMGVKMLCDWWDDSGGPQLKV